MTMLRHKRPTASYGTADFTARLAAREAALGLADTAGRAPDVPMVPADEAQRDRWGNILTSPLGWYGQYTFISQWGDGRTVYVCGQPEQHVRHWRFDGRRAGQGYICQVCHTIEAGMFGSVERGR